MTVGDATAVNFHAFGVKRGRAVMPVTHLDDKVWFDTHRKLREIRDEVRAEVEQGTNVLALSHFPASLSQLVALLREAAVPHQNFSAYDSARLCSSPAGTVWTGLARAFHSPAALQATNPIPIKLKIIIVEHHPRYSQDQAILETAARLPCHAELGFYFSLDDALLLHFNGDSLQKLFKTIGIDESESLSHHLITAAIRTAQEKIEGQLMRDLQAESIEDWFKYNLPGDKRYP